MTLLLHPYLPNSSATLLDALDQTGLELEDFGSRPGGGTVKRIDPLFPKLEAPE